jgi:hypothetical protein
MSMLTPYKQLFIQTFHYNGNLITEQGTGEQNPLFQLAMDTVLKSHIGTIPTPHSDQLQLSHTLIYKLLVIYSYPLQLTSTTYCKYSYIYAPDDE